ncbi:unnamed protein product [[Candida] boidinii]|nr:unnamed protein product [[Candida] boidinii]
MIQPNVPNGNIGLGPMNNNNNSNNNNNNNVNQNSVPPSSSGSINGSAGNTPAGLQFQLQQSHQLPPNPTAAQVQAAVAAAQAQIQAQAAQNGQVPDMQATTSSSSSNE